MSFGFSCCIDIVAILDYFGVGSIAFEYEFGVCIYMIRRGL
jgi:hypothetical protein